MNIKQISLMALLTSGCYAPEAQIENGKFVEENNAGEIYSGCEDLSKFPPCYITDGEFDSLIVVGAEASSSDSLAATDVATAFVQYVTMDESVLYDCDIQTEEIMGIISVGRNNDVSKLFSSQLNQGLDSAQGRIQLVKLGSYMNLLVDGGSDDATRLAAQVLSNRYTELSGQGVIVEGDSWSTASIRNTYD